MDSKAHQHIVEKAIEWLSGDAKTFWSQNKEAMVAASRYPDIFAAPKHVDAEKVKIEQEWRELVHVDIDDENSHLHVIFDPDNIRTGYPDPLKQCLQRIAGSLENGRHEYAAKLAGCFSHVIGDTGQPAHVVGDEVAAELLPFQNQDKYMVYHSAVESIIGQANTAYTPQLLGVKWAEIEWCIVEKLTQLRRLSRSQYMPILSAIYRNDMEQAQIGADITVQACSELFCDIIYTLYYQHIGEFEDADFAKLAKVELKSLIPVDCFCDMMFCYAPMIDSHPDFSMKDGITYQLVDFNLGIGSTCGGIALFPNMAPGYEGVREAFVDYVLPPNIYSTFEGVPGLNHNCENGTDAIFEVWLDDKMVFQSQPINDKMSAKPVKIEIGDAACIRLVAKDARPAPCSTEFFYPIWGNPILKQ